MRQRFGGDWTEEKLERVKRYLEKWTLVMKNLPFSTVYIDAFAGTGYREQRQGATAIGSILPELTEEEPQRFMDGSARIALQVEPEFDRYIFIEMSQRKAHQLAELKGEYPLKADRITVKISDANRYLQEVCARPGWEQYRAVLFLDPFGMEVTWETIQAVASTKAIDLWYLFPLGINRMLTNTGEIPEHWANRLTALFGTSEWYDAFYRQKTVPTLFGDAELLEKWADFPIIEQFILERLRSVFPGVADNPLTLCNSHGAPLFLLCFAVSNPSPRARDAALRIATHILKMR